MNKPSVSIMEIFKLMFLLFNPESDFPKDNELPLIKSKCLNMSPKDIKRKLKMILQDISWITPEFLRKLTQLTVSFLPETMKYVSAGAKDIAVYFQNLMKYKELYDKVNRKEKPEKIKLAKIKKIIEIEIGKNKKSLNELNNPKKEEKNSLLAKLDSCEKIMGLLTSISDCL